MMLDGNALAGRLADLLGLDATDHRLRCPGCGATERVALAAVYFSDMGAVARCARCDAVVVVLVEGDGRAWIRFPAALEILPADRPASGGGRI